MDAMHLSRSFLFVVFHIFNFREIYGESNIIRNPCKKSGVFFLVGVNIKVTITPIYVLFVETDDECMRECMEYTNCRSLTVSVTHGTQCKLYDKDQNHNASHFQYEKKSRYYDTGIYSEKVGSHCNSMVKNPCKNARCIDSCQPPFFTCHKFRGQSCNDIRQTYRHLQLKDGFYVVGGMRAFCDMNTAEGGWLRVGKVDVESNMVGYLNPEIDSLACLSYNDSNYILGPVAMHNLRIRIPFTQLRIYCYKSYHKRSVHIMTTRNRSGFDVVDYVTKKTSQQPVACQSYVMLSDDNSLISRDCIHWSNNNKWDTYELAKHPMMIWFGSHVGFNLGRVECDDYKWSSPFKTKGKWRYFVR